MHSSRFFSSGKHNRNSLIDEHILNRRRKLEKKKEMRHPVASALGAIVAGAIVESSLLLCNCCVGISILP
jgi:hypothetical protein